MTYSKELLQKTIDIWQPNNKVPLTEEDAREIAQNTVSLFKLLVRLDQKYNVTKNHSASVIPINKKTTKSGDEDVGDQLVGANKMAEIVGVPVSWIYERTRQGNTAIPHIKLGKYVRFNPREVIEFFKNKSKNESE